MRLPFAAIRYNAGSELLMLCDEDKTSLLAHLRELRARKREGGVFEGIVKEEKQRGKALLDSPYPRAGQAYVSLLLSGLFSFRRRDLDLPQRRRAPRREGKEGLR